MIPSATVIVLVFAAILVLSNFAQGAEFDAPNVTANVTTSAQNQNFAQAIAFAEGFGTPGAIPTLANNPGDLVIPKWAGAKLGEGISVFSSVAEGWNRLYAELNLIVAGNSSVYSLSDTISTMGAKWTTTQSDAWAQNVASYLGVSTDTPLSQLLA